VSKRKFASFGDNEALKELGVEQLLLWEIAAAPLAPTPFFIQRLKRLEGFELTTSERGKELLIDAFCEEILERHTGLKIWKEAAIQTETTTGFADYLVAPRRAYLETPLLCVIEAKKDKFDQGMAQCLVGMAACADQNQKSGRPMATFGIVSNGQGWQFYRLDLDGSVWQSGLYSVRDPDEVLGVLNTIFGLCEAMLV
jgi:hypothetical protein